MSAWQIYKFGGSSLGAPGRLGVVLRRVGEARRPLALVVSALGDTTEWLLEAAGAAAAGHELRARSGLDRALHLVRERGAEVLGPAGLATLEAPWAEVLADGARALSAIATAPGPAPLDLLLSVGERLSAPLVAA